jgi:hypothetical protein
MIITYEHQDAFRSRARDRILFEKKLDPNFRVIDIGGIAGAGWTNDLADLIVDINAPLNNPKYLHMDICDSTEWHKMFDASRINSQTSGKDKFDYAICNHTLEDIYNPIITLQMLPSIAKAGMIGVPSIMTELSREVEGDWLGYHHHRWIFDQTENGELLLASKLNFLEKIIKNPFTMNVNVYQTSYDWSGSLPFKILLDNYSDSISRSRDAYEKMVLDAIVRIRNTQLK